MSVMSPRDFARYANEPEFEWMVRRLAAYTAHRLERHGRARLAMDEPLDFVHEAIRLVLDGSRHVAAADDRAIFRALAGIVDSLTIHAREKLERRGRRLSIATPGAEPHEGELGEDQLAHLDPVEDETIARETLDHFVKKLDPQLRRYVRTRVEHDDFTAEDHARQLNVEVSDIRNLDRRLNRRRPFWLAAASA